MARSRTTWTADQARQMVERRKAAVALRAKRNPLPPVEPNPPERVSDFPDRLLQSVRARVGDILAALESECRKQRPDASQLDRLASALERLAGLERVLDGRPLPGSRRPPREDPPSARRQDRRAAAAPLSPPAPSAPQPPDPPLADDDEPEPPRFTPAEL